MKLSHPLGFDPQGKSYLIRRHNKVIHRLVRASKGIELPPCPIDHLVDRGPCDVVGGLEHEMLEKVRKARTAGILVARANLVVEDRGDDRCRMIFVQDDVQTIWQVIFFELDRFVLSTHNRRGKDHRDRRHQYRSYSGHSLSSSGCSYVRIRMLRRSAGNRVASHRTIVNSAPSGGRISPRAA